MLDGKWSVVIDEIERQSVVDVYGRERSGTGFRPAHTEEVRETLGRNALISGGHDDVIQFYRHLRSLGLSPGAGVGRIEDIQRRELRLRAQAIPEVDRETEVAGPQRISHLPIAQGVLL